MQARLNPVPNMSPFSPLPESILGHNYENDYGFEHNHDLTYSGEPEVELTQNKNDLKTSTKSTKEQSKVFFTFV